MASWTESRTNVGGSTAGSYIGSTASASTSRLAIQAINTFSIGFYNNGISGARVSSITNNGTTVNYNSGSDYRIKRNVVPLTNALQTLESLHPIVYTYINENINQDGFLAHELQDTIPEAVFGDKDAIFLDGTPKLQQVAFGKLIPLLLA